MKKYSTQSIKPLFFGLMTFIFILSITLIITFQQINFQEQKEKEELAHELNHVEDRFRNILYSDITAANSLAIFYQKYGLTADLYSISAQIIRYNKYAEVLQLTLNGVIKKVYPLKGYEKTIGLNTSDFMRLMESKRAVERNDVYFAGPRKLRQGGIGILGKVPVRRNKDELAICVVMTKLETIRNALNLDADPTHKFSYWLIKKSDKRDNSTYFLSKEQPADISKAVYTDIPEGDWILGAAFGLGYSSETQPLVTPVLGALLALLSSILIFRISSQPFKLKKIIAEKTKELADQEKYYRTIIHTSTDAIVLIDDTGKIQYQTPSADRIVGYTLEEIKQIDPSELIHPDHRDFDSKTFQDFIGEAGSKLTANHQIKHKDGRYIWIEGTYLNLLQDETIHAIVLTYSDITQRKHMEDERQRLFEERLSIIDHLTSRNRDLEQFSFIVSHNIRAPLANILGLTTMLNDARYDAELKKKAIEGIQVSAKNLDSILSDLNDILQTRNEISEKKSEFKFSEKVEKIKQLLTDVIQSKKVVIETDFTQIDSIHSIRSYIHAIFYNLISNSIKYAQVGIETHIKIWSEKIDEKIVLHFKDNGLGFNLEKDGQAVFGLYKRFNTATEGKGMGLFMVKTQVEALQGSIELRSRPNEGAHFIITFQTDQ